MKTTHRRKSAPRPDRFTFFDRAVGATRRRVRWAVMGNIYLVDWRPKYSKRSPPTD
jgi:hypothetical protein